MTEKRLLRIGHRGAPSHFWENTIQSIQKAIELGVDMVEFDIRRTLDNHFVLFHADSIRRFPFRGKIGRKPLRDLLEHRVGPGERIPLLQEAIDAIKGKAYMNIDLKAPGGEEDLVEMLVRKGVENQVLVSSNFAKSLKRIKDLEPKIRTGISIPKDWFGVSRVRDNHPVSWSAIWLLRHTIRFWALRRIRAAEADAVMVYYRLLTPNLVEKLHNLGMQVFAYTVDDARSIQKVIDMGVQGIASNRPELLVRGT